LIGYLALIRGLTIGRRTLIRGPLIRGPLMVGGQRARASRDCGNGRDRHDGNSGEDTDMAHYEVASW
jgi:hypothetical protein